jgi:Lon protease-like protein
MVLYDVPLFPLRTVLFPKMILPLHIFEPRYRQMINDCVRDNQPFGVILIDEGSEIKQTDESNPVSEKPPVLHRVGTLAKIADVTRLEDGRMLINTIGTERFRLLDHRETKAFMTGDIEIWPEGEVDVVSSDLQALVDHVTEVFQSYLEILMELAHQSISLNIPDDFMVLSYLIPHWLPQIELEDKQKLLEVSDPVERLNQELLLLLRETEFLNKIKQRAEQDAQNEETDSQNPPGYNITRRFSAN